MRVSLHIHTTQKTMVSDSVALSHRDKQKERDREYVSHLCDTHCSRVIGWFGPLCFFSSTSLPCQATESWSSACVLLLFIHLSSESPVPSLFLVIISHSWLSQLSAPHFSIFTSPSCFYHLSVHLPVSLFLSLYLLSWVDSVESWWIRLHVTVWHLSESDAVNMVPADSPVEIVHSGEALRHSHTFNQLTSLTPLIACLCRGRACVYLCVYV